MADRTYTEAEAAALVNAAIAREREAADERAGESYRKGYAEGVAAMKEERAQGYRVGISGEERCGAVNPGVTLRGEPVLCQREPGHQLGPYDRHKAIDNATEPHQAFVWND